MTLRPRNASRPRSRPIRRNVVARRRKPRLLGKADLSLPPLPLPPRQRQLVPLLITPRPG